MTRLGGSGLYQLYERYKGPVFGYLLRLCGDHSLAQELTDDTFYRALLAIDSLRAEASLKAWLLRIARNLFLERCRQEARAASLEELEQAGGWALPSDQPDPQEACLRRERGEAIQRALLSLPEGDRSLLLLAALDELTGREIAEVLGISVAAVKVRLCRARRRLVAALGQEYALLETRGGMSPARQEAIDAQL